MLQAFLDDKSGFKGKVLIVILFSILALLASVFISTAFFNKTAQNHALAAQYTSQSAWLQKFDFKDASALYTALLKPCKAAELERVQAEQLDILQKNNLKILSVKNEAAKKVKGKAYSSQQTTVTASGAWPDIQKAIAEFEKKNLVVIVDADISTDKEGIKAKLAYQTYFM